MKQIGEGRRTQPTTEQASLGMISVQVLPPGVLNVGNDKMITNSESFERCELENYRNDRKTI